MPGLLPLAVALAYVAVLFGFAAWAEGGRHSLTRATLRKRAYVMALAVYCTSWTYYGAVGSAVSDGWSYLPIYLGPVLVLAFAPKFLTRLVSAVKADGANSISEFIGGRFGSSRGVAATVTILALMGNIPYIALQLRAIGTTFDMLSGVVPVATSMAVSAALLALFAMLYGTRRYEAGARNDAILFAVGIESLLKIVALIAAGALAIWLLATAPAAARDTAFTRLGDNFSPSLIGADFFVITLLGMAAILCLPRQFYIGVIEAGASTDLEMARKPFIAYIAITALLVLPITAAGMMLYPGGARPDLFVLQIAQDHGGTALALFVFLGGFSAASAMVLVETIALSTMVANDIVAPLLLKRADPDHRMIARQTLIVRRAVIAAIMCAALAWALGIPDKQRLAQIGLVAFAAMAQFAPALILAVYRPNRDALAAQSSLIVGLIVWAYTLALPQIASAGWMESMQSSWLNPYALLGIDGLSPISHGTLWSLGANIATFALVTARRVQTAALPALLRNSDVSETQSVSNIGELRTLVERFVSPDFVATAFADLPDHAPIDRREARTAERLIAGVVGLPSARALVGAALFGANLTHRDVTRLLDHTGQSLQFSKGLLAATLEHIDPGVSVIDHDLNLIAWNSRYLDLFDYPEGLVRVGAPVADLIRYNALRGECGPGEVDEHVQRRIDHMRAGRRHSFERTRPDGRVLKTVGGPMPGGGYVMCFSDITTEARAHAALERARAELEARVAARTAELQQANAALALADQDKTRFLAAASHDLLQPLHAARLFTAALGRELQSSQQRMLDRVDRSIDSADQLLRALLDISKLDAGGITPRPERVPLDELLWDLVETLAPLAAEKSLSLRYVSTAAIVDTDPALLRSIVQNLLSNAIRYTNKGGIVVGVRPVGDALRIEVVDTGPGIPPSKQQQIFREFERLDTRNQAGNGLGLAIVERTARLLDLHLFLRSVEGRGSRFGVVIPRAAPSGAAPSVIGDPSPLLAATTANRPPQTTMTVLIVDDNPLNGVAMASYVDALGHQSLRFSDGESALATLDHHPVDLALIDFDLGSDRMDGLTVIAAVRARQPMMPCILVTAERADAVHMRAAAMNVPLLQKPLRPDALLPWIGAATTPTTQAAE